MKYIVLVLFSINAFCDSTVNYNGFQVYKVVPKTQTEVEALQQLQLQNSKLDFWTDPTRIGKPVHIMVGPDTKMKFKKFLRGNNLTDSLKIKDVQTLIDSASRRPRIRSIGFDFKDYHELSVINAYLEDLAYRYSRNVRIIYGGKSYEGKNVTGVHLSFSKKNQNNSVFIEAGIHGREWISPATSLYILTELLTSENTSIREVAERHDWHIFPVVNPDSYEVTHTRNRMWRKTTKPNEHCVGTDPNRNWDFHWGSGGQNAFECAETYSGSSAFSEIETRSLAEYISSISNKLFAYISFHSFGQFILSPYGHTYAPVDNFDELKVIAEKAIDSLSVRYNTEYLFGTLAESTSSANGSSIDWVKGKFGTRFVYLYELRDSGDFGFLLPPEEIIPTGEETLDSLITLLSEAFKVSNRANLA